VLVVSRGYDLFVSPSFFLWRIYAVFCGWVICGLMVFGFLRRWQRWITQCNNVYVTQCARLFCFFRFARVQSHQNRFFFQGIPTTFHRGLRYRNGHSTMLRRFRIKLTAIPWPCPSVVSLFPLHHLLWSWFLTRESWDRGPGSRT